ncbi:hypothetical protein IDH32_00625 [Pelagibacterales bacterium SAG-MED01]|nr:hypothetical protein [Pelagibacterales bacterium SAG-MED01]
MNIFRLIVIKALIYFFYNEYRLFVRKIKYLIIFNKELSFFKYLQSKEKNYHILKDEIKKKALEKNFIFWTKFIKKNEIFKSNSEDTILITSLVSTKFYTIYNNIIGLYLSKKLKNDFVGLIKHDDFETEIFMRSFGIKKIHYINDGNFFSRFKYFLSSINLIDKIHSTDDFLKLKYEGVFVGKIVYDHYIRFTGIASVEYIDPKFYYFLSKTLRIHHDYKKILKSNSFKNIIQAETQFIPSCIIFQNSLLNNSTVYSKLGGASNQISVRIYNDIKHVYKNRYRFSSKLFNLIYEKYKHLALDSSKEIIKHRFLGTFGYEVDHDAEENSQHKIEHPSNLIDEYAKIDICKKYGWDENKPIGVIFSIDLTDGIFTDSWRLFKDNLSWMRETLESIKHIDHVNWLIKAHPNDIIKKVVTTTQIEVRKLSKDYNHIKEFPVEYSNNSLNKFITAAVTLNGSVGYEYPSLGVPTIICGETIYSGKSFNYEPKTKNEYFELLKNLEKLEKPTNDQIDKARTFIYLYSVLGKVTVPIAPGQKIGKESEIRFWKDFSILIDNYDEKKDDFMRNFNIQLKKLDQHTINYNYLEK